MILRGPRRPDDSVRDQGRPPRPLPVLACWPFRREELVRIHASSGTHGQPTVVELHPVPTSKTWTELMARCMTMAGVRPGDVDPQCQRLRAVHRRPRLSPGRRADRGGRLPISGGARQPGDAPSGTSGAGSFRHPRTRWRSRRVSTTQEVARRQETSARSVRRRAVDRASCEAESSGARALRDQLLRPVGDVRAGRRRGVPGRATTGCM